VTTVVHWFRRDLRVSDNTSLSSAARDADRVVPVFILDDHYANDPNVGPARFRFLRESLSALAEKLPSVGGRLLLRRGPASEALPALLKETGAAAVYANLEIGPYPERRDRDAQAAVERSGARFRLFPDALLVEPDAIATGAGDPFTVYTPFSRKWMAAEKRRPEPDPARLATPQLQGIPLERVRSWRDLPPNPAAPKGGESKARALLASFLSAAVRDYADARNFPARLSTSRLSPHLHFGTISPRTVRSAAVEAWKAATPAERESVNRFVLELAWREFYHHVLFHFPRVAEGNFKPEFDRLPWQSSPEGLAAWKAGRTGFPLVDAAMRELSTTHWMHNRARMVAASFLAKDLHVHWREGEKWFERELADADLANNNGGWQWAAGTGTDAAPYFRIFHPVLQSKRFDPEGAYIRRFVPELARVPLQKIHEPWTMTGEEQRAAGCRIGADYPAPIADHARQRRVALSLFEAVKNRRSE
jgi:deoxyribodipyrimidine photo-lyase